MATTVTVTGDFFAGPGVPASGMAYWQLSSPLFDSGGELIATTEVIAAPINGGQMSVILWANDDRDVQPAGTYWTITVWLDESNPGSVISTLQAAYSAKYVIKTSYAPSVSMTDLPQAVLVQTFTGPTMAFNIDGGSSRTIFMTSGLLGQTLEGGAARTVFLASNVLDAGNAGLLLLDGGSAHSTYVTSNMLDGGDA
jgi:hypothetical protein